MADNGTITTDVLGGDIDSAAEALLKRWGIGEDGKPKKETPRAPAKAPEPPAEVEDDQPEDEEVEDHDTEVEDNDPEDTEDEDEDEDDAPESSLADDDHEVVVRVGDQESRVKVGDLKRLYGQEASLTQKSQEVARFRQAAEEQATRHVTALEAMKQRAEEAFKPFQQIDWVLAQAQLNPQEFQALRAQHKAVEDQVKYYGEELNNTITARKADAEKQLHEEAKVCVAALSNPESPYHIPNFGGDTWKDIGTYAMSLGVPETTFTRIVDPVALKILHKAMMYDKGQVAAVKKLNAAPKNVAGKTPSNTPSTDPNRARNGKAMDRLKKSGSADDAAAALLSRWQNG